MAIEKQIVVDRGTVFISEGVGVELDTSELSSANIAFYGNTGSEEWIEKDPFNGKEEIPSDIRTIIDRLFVEANEEHARKEKEIQDKIDAENNKSVQSVSRRQARQQLLLDGVLDQVQPSIDAIADETQKRLMQIYWDDAQTFDRYNSELQSIASSLGLTSEQLDAMFTNASKL